MRVQTSLLAGMLALLLTQAKSNASVQVASTYFTGSRTTVGTTGTGGGLVWNPAAGDWSGGKFSLSWLIIDNGSDYTYKYTINTPTNGSAKLSHWILELSPLDVNGGSLESYWEQVFVTKTTGSYSSTGIGSIPAGEVGLTGSQSGNPGMPDVDDGNATTDADKDDIFGVRFSRSGEVSTTTVQFTTAQVPVWGDFYAKDGGGTGADAVYAYNIGFGTDPTGTDFTNWIPRPDGIRRPDPDPQDLVPESTSLLIWGGLAIVSAYGARKRNRTA